MSQSEVQMEEIVIHAPEDGFEESAAGSGDVTFKEKKTSSEKTSTKPKSSRNAVHWEDQADQREERPRLGLWREESPVRLHHARESLRFLHQPDFRPNESVHRQDRGDLGQRFGEARGRDDSFNQNKRPKIMPDHYDGKKSFQDFLAHFEVCAEINEWNEVQKTCYLRASLRDQACQVMTTLPGNKKHIYDELIAALSMRFNPSNQTELYRVELRNRCRQPKETLPELGQDIKRLVSLAFPSASSDILDTLGKDHFIDAIDDGDIRWRIYQSKPSTMDEAVCAAVELEAYKTAEKQRYTNKRYVRAFGTQNNGETSTSPTHSTNEELQSEVARLKKILASQKRTSTSYNATKDKSNITCWYCGQKGHYKTECPEIHQQGKKSSNC